MKSYEALKSDEKSPKHTPILSPLYGQKWAKSSKMVQKRAKMVKNTQNWIFLKKIKIRLKNNFCEKFDPKWLKFGKNAFFWFRGFAGNPRDALVTMYHQALGL